MKETNWDNASIPSRLGKMLSGARGVFDRFSMGNEEYEQKYDMLPGEKAMDDMAMAKT